MPNASATADSNFAEPKAATPGQPIKPDTRLMARENATSASEQVRKMEDINNIVTTVAIASPMAVLENVVQ